MPECPDINTTEEHHLENTSVAFGICLYVRYLEVNKTVN